MHHLQSNQRVDSLKYFFIADALIACEANWHLYDPPACSIAFSDEFMPTGQFLDHALDLCETAGLAGCSIAKCSCSSKHKNRDRVIYYKIPPEVSRPDIEDILIGEEGGDIFKSNPLLTLYLIDIIMHDIFRLAVQDAQKDLNSSDLGSREFPDFTDRPYLLKNTINYRALHFLLRYSIGEIYGIFYDWIVFGHVSFTTLCEGLRTDMTDILCNLRAPHPSCSEFSIHRLSIFVKVFMSRWLYVVNGRELSCFRLSSIMK
ncbi:hypothetical protein [Marinobacterium rhizophilum]|uniref:Uncharacterized protein n=1 Tax=Marinobacterium rhizophilum TaxID=420402 RepID=A0ABY5HHV3_9GAMM|nr:hypothetical protein [Marinobacterium rhizophilum]UTW11426.1 hypothetical protein KDW95_19540 [Marinobacterium rhizophilum]